MEYFGGDMESVKIAYLLLCHKDPYAINELINRLDDGNCDFYIHIDKKSSDDIVNGIKTKENVRVIQERVDVKWGQVSQPLATIALFNSVVESNKQYDYVWLISGQDYPIKSNRQIQKFLLDNFSKNFVDIIDNNSKEYKLFVKRNETWYPKKIVSPTTLTRVLRKVYIILTGGANRSIIRRKNVLQVESYQFGSSWFTITYDAMQYVLEELTRKGYIKFYTNAICPDESIFQTILYNSKYKDSLMPSLVYVDWSEGNRNPKLLNEDDYDKLKASDKLIARKFDGEINEKIKILSDDSEI